MPAQPLLRIADVGVRRGAAELLRRVDWTVRPGERWAVLGANGAGKTTLLQVASGALRPEAGTVEVLGEPLATADLDELQPRIGWCSAALADQLPPEEHALDVVLTAAYAVVRRGGEPYDDLEIGRARHVLTQVGCRHLADRTLGTLSEGERKRVQIARALMTDPELLLLDEPAAGLDLGGREALLRMLGRLASDPGGPALVMVTHHVEEIPTGFTHALLLRQGEVVAAGPLGEVLTAGHLSACFGLPLVVEASAGRYTARAGLPPGRR